ncbi:MAG TPA: NAD-dependent epimerase/dehydratase family protein [Bryobacteraceae bacterium]|nr:NAD-dependent epimerase/dehydratase family protein [Bryobacteraceae bacterium]
MAGKQTILITGVSGNLGARLVKQLADSQVIGADIREPSSRDGIFRFEKIDLAEERSCDQLLELMRAYNPEAVAHLAFVAAPERVGGPDEKAMWQVNVVGTSRAIEAIAEHNRMSEDTGGVEKFIFTSSAAIYGPHPAPPVVESAPARAESLVWAEQQQEADRTVQQRAAALRRCKTYILRSHLYGGADAQNYELAALRGTPGARRLGQHLRRRGRRLPLFLPSKGSYLENKLQFVHADDVAGLIAYIVRRPQTDPRLTILNVAGHGDPLTLRRCVEIAGSRVKLLPGIVFCQEAMRLLWDWGASDIPPQALPYLLGSCALETTRLRLFLGEHYRSVIQHTSEEALIESLEGSRKPWLSSQLMLSANA